MGDIKLFQTVKGIVTELVGCVVAVKGIHQTMIKSNLRRIHILEGMAQNLYREWFVKFLFLGHQHVKMIDSPLGKIPEGCGVKPIEVVCSRGTEKAQESPKSVDDGYPMASVKDMHDIAVNVASCRKIYEKDYLDLKENDCAMIKGDVLVAKDGSYLKHIFGVDETKEIALLSSIAMLPANIGINIHLLAFALKEPNTLMRMKKCVSGAALPRIILKEFIKVLIVVLSKDVQIKWKNIVEPQISYIWKLISKNELLAKTRELLLSNLISNRG